MRSLAVRSNATTLALVAVVAAALFPAAGTTCYPQGWALVGLLLATMTATNAYLLRAAPALLERRLLSNQETEVVQRVAMLALRFVALAMFITAGLDRRLGWSRVPAGVAWAALVVVAAGALLIFLVLRENRFASVTVGVEPEQAVVSSGPYRVVRHPMYLGALLQGFAIPIALGSYWAEALPVAACAAIALRLLAEERLLFERLPGYAEYARRTRRRLVPGMW
jgi:protein-S-isoprenylcysteine O-methyltransferase Ste14